MLWGVSITKLANAVITLRRANTTDKHDMLFEAWDLHKDGKVRFTDVEQGLKQLKASSEELHVEVVAEAAVKAIPPNSNAATHTFGRKEFRRFTDNLVLQMAQTFGVVSELLLLGALELQPRDKEEFALLKEIKGKVDEEAKVAAQHIFLAEDETVVRLFEMFNTSGSGRLSFSEVAHMLHKLRQDISLRQARAETINLMLLLDQDSERSLGKIEFARFLQKISTLMCMDPVALADILIQIRAEETKNTLDDAATALMLETQHPITQVYETLGDRKLHLLFELWDKDADGTISFAEVCLGLRKFCHDSEPANETASDAAEALLIFDADSDQRLDWADFARFINQFCEACGTQFCVLSEYLILLAALDDNPTEELAFLLSEDTVEKAIVGVDKMWRQGALDRARSDVSDSANSSLSSIPSKSGQQGLRSLTSGVQGLQLSDGGSKRNESEYSEGASLQRVTSDLHKSVRTSPFEASYPLSDIASEDASEASTPIQGGLQGHGSSLGRLRSSKSRLSYKSP